jgi:hypothetical protein
VSLGQGFGLGFGGEPLAFPPGMAAVVNIQAKSRGQT